ncbi:uncharacterized protein LOC110991147 isoform X3 [Acanthaster planci]|uniref:Uncharacterized protein LOC110991147 isoform X3 n=1 Tax=Acanthaster planci TaxID=133434 RepID=A0A8B8A564_ACAPL|nr:uncharacterized protein LOC110991147 isoform X3 [Acanthaster planci]
MGHDLKPHREYYQLPDTVQRVTKLSRLFLSLERGNLSSQQGKSLDDLHVTGGQLPGVAAASRTREPSPPSRRVKRRPWTTAEKTDVQEGLRKFFQLRKVPDKLDIEAACTVALQTRTWRNIKDFCRNTMKL